MRLTLRTLLAHLDGVQIDSEESTELAKKIEESDFVRNLVQRIRTTMVRPRLPGPKIDGQGLGHDANTVAAYLDNTLPQDRMPDFEKICLESDILLAEVGACHQVLSLVLQQPAKVPPRLRDRVYRIGDLGKPVVPESHEPGKEPPVAPPVVEPPAAQAISSAVVSEKPEPHKAEPRKHEIPDYLRETQSLGWKPLALTVLAGFLLAAVLLRLMGPFDANHPILGALAGPRQVAQTDTVPADRNETASDSEEPVSPESGETADVEAINKAPTSTGETEAVSPAEVTSKEQRQEVAAPPIAPVAGAAASAGSSAVASENAATAVPPSAADPSPDVSPKEAPETNVASTPPTSAEAPVASAKSKTGDMSPTSPTTEEPIPAAILAKAPSIEPVPPQQPPAPADLGRFISEREVLARLQEGTSGWVRLPTNQPLGVGDQLLALPAFRPKISLASGMQITLSGGTQVQLLAPSKEDAAHLGLSFGRVIIVPVAGGGSVRFDFWGRQGVATFTDATAVMAVQLRQYRSPGVNPEAGLAHRMVEIFADGGSLIWNEDGHPEQLINTGETFAFLDDTRGGVSPTDQKPAWIDGGEVDGRDQLASQEMERLLTLERPLSLSLLELAEHRKSEVKSLAVRTLGYLDLFEGFVNVFSDPGQSSHWDDHFNELQRVLARSPQTAAEVRIAYEKIRGRPLALELYRLLWSYSPEDLAGGDAEKLVAYLSHESLDVRVLAIENLRRITGATHLYRPEVTEVRRRTPVQRWRDSLTSGEIKYSEKILMLPPRLPEPAPTIEEDGDDAAVEATEDLDTVIPE
jgi:hypothetical protein